MASAAARLLHLAGFRVLVLERDAPLAVRRLVCFAEAVLAAETAVEGVTGRLLAPCEPVPPAPDHVCVAVDPDGALITRLRPRALLDGRMAKRNLGTRRGQAPVVVGLGPGFVAGEDVHAVVETQRGPELGRVLWSGAAQPDTKAPAPVMGFGEERVARSPRAGVFRASARIGDLVGAGALLGHVGTEPVRAGIAGLVRGLLADGVVVGAGVKLGDLDPRGAGVDPARLSDKARAVAAGALEAVLVGLRSPGRRARAG